MMIVSSAPNATPPGKSPIKSHNLKFEHRAFAESVDYATRMLGLNVTGTAGSLELWGLLQAFTQPEAGQRVAVFVPSYLGPVIPAVLPEASRRNCDDPKTPLDICICDAYTDYDNCEQDARNLFAMGAGMDGLGLIVGLLFCMLKWGVLITPATAAVVCALGAAAAVAIALATMFTALTMALNNCARDLTLDLGRCERDHLPAIEPSG